MAITSTTITPSITRFPYIGQGMAADGPIPQAEFIFRSLNATVDAAAAGESQNFIINCTLPPIAAYVLSECTLDLRDAEVGDIDTWEDDLVAELENTSAGVEASGRWRIMNRMQAGGIQALASETLAQKSYILTNPSNKIIIGINGGSGRLGIRGATLTIDQGAMSLSFVAKFLEFSLAQAHHWAVNTPWPVR